MFRVWTGVWHSATTRLFDWLSLPLPRETESAFHAATMSRSIESKPAAAGQGTVTRCHYHPWNLR